MPDSPAAAESADVVIVGARCAGAASAITLARAGFRVIVLDAAPLPSDTLSTHLLWPAGLAELQHLGALTDVLALGAPRLTNAYAAGAGYGIGTTFPTVEGIDYALCVRRTGLDDVLVRTARAAGAEVRQRCRVTSVVHTGNRCAGVRYTDRAGNTREIRAALVIGADGRDSTVAHAVGAARPQLTLPRRRHSDNPNRRAPPGNPPHTPPQMRARPHHRPPIPIHRRHLHRHVQPPAPPSPS
uniref:NAD(P)/FAD-dependent oxidoreductase n=1 Tax=Nocardia neocaledoniensis TaxID=236511 RepID=UPI002457914D